MRHFYVCVCLAIIVLTFGSVLTVQGTPTDTIACYRLRNSVELDGKLTSADEWRDTTETTLKEFLGGTNYDSSHDNRFRETRVKVKHDNESIYILFNSTLVSDCENPDKGSPWQHDFEVVIDSEKDAGSYPQIDDTLYWAAYRGDGYGLGKGDGVKWSYQKSWMNFTFTYTRGYSPNTKNSPSSELPTLFCEFKVPMPLKEEVGFFLLVNVAAGLGRCCLVWPTDFSFTDDPGSWGILKISRETYELTSPSLSSTPSFKTSVPPTAPSTEEGRREDTTRSPTPGLVPQQPLAPDVVAPTPARDLNRQLEKVLPLIGLGTSVMIIATVLYELSDLKKPAQARRSRIKAVRYP